jgi:hypothetical protein
MRHPRVRRPFVVESRGSGRDGSAIAIPKRVQLSPSASSKPSAHAAAPLFDPWAAVTAPAEPIAAPRRILPNIMPAPEPEPSGAETEAKVPAQEETRLPRVRRVKPPAPRPAVTVAPPVVAPPPAPIVPQMARPEPSGPARPVSRLERGDRSTLPAGQRWKARLPRACW